MNKRLYRKIFSQRLGAVVAVAETAMSEGKRPGQSRRAARAAAMLAALGLAGSAAFGQTTVTFTGPGDIAGMAGWLAVPLDQTTWQITTSDLTLGSLVRMIPNGLLTLDGGTTVNTLTLTGNGIFTLATTNPSNPYNLNLNNITLTGGHNTATTAPDSFGAAVTTQNNLNRSLTINATGTVALTNNTTDNGNGGALYSGGLLTVNVDQSFTLSGNKATAASGGAVYTFTGGGVALTGGPGSEITLDGNSAPAGAGGAIFVLSTTAPSDSIIDAGTITITNNSSSQLGGAIITSNPGTLTIGSGSAGNNSVVEISDNTSTTSSGGAISVSGFGIGTAFTLDGSQITLSDNSALNSNGGAIYSASNTTSLLTIGNASSTATVTISGNSAKYGGALATSATTIHGSDIEISDNHAAALGGAIYVTNSAYPLLMNDDASAITFSNNSVTAGATGGGGVYSTGPITIGGANSVLTFDGNSGPFGGAVLSDGPGSATFNGGGVFSSNIATYTGGAIYAKGGTLTLNASTAQGFTFSGNTPDAIMFDNTGATASAAAFNATAGNITFEDPIESTATNLTTVTTAGPKAVIFNGPASTSPVYAATTVQGGVFAVQNRGRYGALLADVSTFNADTRVALDVDANGNPIAAVTPLAATAPTTFTVAGGGTLAGGGAGTVRADSFTLGSGTLDISGSGITPDNADVGLPPGAAAANGMSTFSIIASSAGTGVNLSGGTVKFNVCGDQQEADVLDLTSPAITGGATPVFTLVDGCTSGATTGNGILIVQSNSPNADLFAASRTTRDIGGIAYTLNYVADTGTSTYNWYLQSTGGIYVAPPASPIPALSETTLALLALLLGGGAALGLRAKRRQQTI